MSIPASLRPRVDSQTAFWAVWLRLVLTLNGFLVLIALSFIDPAPTGDLTDVGRQLQEARSSVFAADADAALDDVSSQLQAAQRAIALEKDKTWRLRSYERAWGLIAKAELRLDGVRASFEKPTSPATP